jgi:hypothetical protein
MEMTSFSVGFTEQTPCLLLAVISFSARKQSNDTQAVVSAAYFLSAFVFLDLRRKRQARKWQSAKGRQAG